MADKPLESSSSKAEEKPNKSRSNSTRANVRLGKKGSSVRPLEMLAAALSAGDLAADMRLLENGNRLSDGEKQPFAELTAMARNMRRTVNRLKRAADSIDAIAGRIIEGGQVLAVSVGDEASSVDATVSSVAEISASARSISEAVAALSMLAQTTSTSSLEMAASTDEVASNADALAAFVDETASSLEEMAASIRNVATAAEALASASDEAERSMLAIDESAQSIGNAVGETAALADEVQVSAQEGLSVVLETAESMRATRASAEQNERIIKDLHDRSERISEVTRFIDEIADRTNLLALNARILAAQAGQQGRGFGVVAEEIKELSERTARYTEEIDDLVNEVRGSISAAIVQVGQNRELAEEGTRLAEKAATSLNEISAKTGQSARSIRHIADAAATQSTESHHVAEMVGKVRQRAREIDRATAEQAETSRQIGERAVRMSQLTEQVRRAMEEQADASKHIASGVEHLTELVEQIGGAIHEQQSGVDEVLRAMEVIRDSVKKNQASIVQVNYTVGLLDHEASSLRESVAGFEMPMPQRGGHLRYGVPSSIPSLDVLESNTLAGNDLLGLICECLVDPGAGAGVEPALASSWEVAADGRTYTFHLRENARFHNGRRVTPADVVYSVRRTLRNSRAGAWVFANLVGADEFAAGNSDELAGARAGEGNTVELELTEPLAFFLPMLCLRYAAVVPREEIEVDGGMSFLQKPVGTGPFLLEKYDKTNGRIELARFSDYWKENEPYLDSVTLEYSDEGGDLIEKLTSGKLDIMREDSAERIAALRSDPLWRSCIVTAAQLHTQCLVFDAEQPPFDDLRVRMAVAHAIDKKRLVSQAYGGLAVPAVGPIPPGLIGYDPEYRGLEFDPERAKHLLERAGYRRGLKIRFWRSFQEHTASEKGGELVCENLAAVGIECEVKITDTSELLEAAHDGRAQLAEFSWYADYADPDNYTYVLFHSANRKSSIGRVAYVPEVDQLSRAARTVINRAERARLYTELQRLIAENALCVFTAHRRAAVVHRPEIEGLQIHLVSPVIRPHELWLAR